MALPADPEDYLALLEHLGMNNAESLEEDGDFKELRLDENARDSAAWAQIKEILEARLQHLREVNDAMAGMGRKAQLSGAIGEVKNFLAIGQKESFDLPTEDEVETPTDDDADAGHQ